MKKTSKKGLVLLVALALLVGVTAGSTLAWLLDKTETVTNTFTTSNIDIELTETKKDFRMIPGHTIAKDPKVTLKVGSEPCYVFVKVEESTNLDTYITYTVDSGWTQVPNTTGVYYRTQQTIPESDQVWSVITNDTVTVNSTVTQADMTAANASKPSLTFTAYACQLMKDNNTQFTVAEAWELAQQNATQYTPTP